MSTELESGIRRAKKDHRCMACHWMNASSYGEKEFEPDDLAAIKRAEADGWKIKAGQEYFYSEQVDSGEYTHFKARPEIHDICLKYDLYPEY